MCVVVAAITKSQKYPGLPLSPVALREPTCLTPAVGEEAGRVGPGVCESRVSGTRGDGRSRLTGTGWP
jgi:hypothetical protein